MNKKRVFVGMSGGVDSSVSAALLQKAGYDVTGVFIKVWQPDWIECTWKDERRDAMRVAAHLGIPFITLDLVKEYKKGVIDYMIAEYSRGRTPNPDVMCNREVKFGAFWQWAKKQGADYIATGHYARTKSIESAKSIKSLKSAQRVGKPAIQPANQIAMLKGNDENKDQSYFLWTLNQDDLKHVIFPVGHIEKTQVRKLAAKFGLPTADKKDSQGLCFIGKVDVKEFLSRYIPIKTGNVLDENGNVIGNHNGSTLLTIGERHGFRITKKTPNDAPYYVIRKDPESNTIIVSNRDSSSDTTSKPQSKNTPAEAILPNATKSIMISSCNWTRRMPSIGVNFQIRSRYRQPLQSAKIVDISGQTAKITFEKPQDTLTPGQSLVIYDREECLGGGIIN